MILYGLIFDNGDGSASLRWYVCKNKVDRILSDYEWFYMNEGSPAVTLVLPDGIIPEKIGIDYVDYEIEGEQHEHHSPTSHCND